MTTPRPEHSGPQFERDAWINLNGEWTFTFAPDKSGRERGLPLREGLGRKIIVPFCPESERSGVGHTDFIEAMWYHRTIRVPDDWAGRRVPLHLGAVDYEAEVYIDGHSVGLHCGGTVGFTCDITRWARWNPEQARRADRSGSWGYGDDPTSAEDCRRRIKGLTDAIVDHPNWSGYCYVQLPDVEQEQNGVYFYDRSPKFDADRLGAIFDRKPDWSAW